MRVAWWIAYACCCIGSGAGADVFPLDQPAALVDLSPYNPSTHAHEAKDARSLRGLDRTLEDVVDGAKPLLRDSKRAEAAAMIITRVADEAQGGGLGEAGVGDKLRVREIRHEAGAAAGHAKRRSANLKVLRKEDAETTTDAIEHLQANAERSINMQKAMDRAKRTRALAAEALREKKWMKKHDPKNKIEEEAKAAKKLALKEAKAAKKLGQRSRDLGDSDQKLSAKIAQLARDAGRKSRQVAEDIIRRAKVLEPGGPRLGQSLMPGHGASGKDRLARQMAKEVTREAEAELVHDTNTDKQAIEHAVLRKRKQFETQKKHVLAQEPHALSYLHKEASWIEADQQQTRDEANAVLQTATQLKSEVDVKLTNTEVMLKHLQQKRAIRLLAQQRQ